MTPSLFISLYLDEDVTKELATILRENGFDAISALEVGMAERTDEEQFEYANSERRAVLTYNIKDYMPLLNDWSAEGREHAGLIVSEQFSKRQLGELVRRTIRMLAALSAEEIRNRVIFLQSFK